MRITLIVVVIAIAAMLSEAKLVSVQTMSRHGIRAPLSKASVLCPNDHDNIVQYDVGFSDITGRGLKEMYQVGQTLRYLYIDTEFLSPTYKDFETTFKASGAPRCLESAEAVSRALYPAGMGPREFLTDKEQLVPVFTTPPEKDNFFESRLASCAKRLAAETNEYLTEGAGKTLVDDNMDMIKYTGEICGFPLTNGTKVVQTAHEHNLVRGFKDVSDMLHSDKLESYPPMKGVTPELLTRMRYFSYDLLQGELFRSDAQVTYIAGDLPAGLVSNFNHARSEYVTPITNPVQKPKGRKLWVMQAHREMMYSVSHFFGMPFSPRFDHGIIPGATTIILELHDIEGEFFVRSYVWAPCTYPTIKETEEGENWADAKYDPASCLPTPIDMQECSLYFKGDKKAPRNQCLLDEFAKVVAARIGRTGSWQELCLPAGGDASVPQEYEELLEHALEKNAELTKSLQACWFLIAFLAVCAFIAAIVFYRRQTTPRYFQSAAIGTDEAEV